MMATTESQPPTRECPFCGQLFRRLGNHLPSCRERGDRDYTEYLSKKTLEKRDRGGVRRKTCPKCQKKFVRLDTHLKRSPTCKSTEGSHAEHPEPDSPVADYPTQPAQPTHHPTTPADLVSLLRMNGPTSPDLPQQLHPEAHLKPRLKLPSSKEDWKRANSYFSQHLLPAVQAAVSPNEKNTILSEGIYDYFAETFGTKKHSNGKHERKRKRHERALAAVTKLKNEARRELRQAKRSGTSIDTIQSISRKFFDLVREHSRVKRSSVSSAKYAQARQARQQCHQDFWRFAKGLLDDKSSSQTSPAFTQEEAFTYFSKVYSTEPRRYSKPSWLPSSKVPATEFEEDEISCEEIDLAINRAKSASAPSPFDQISYQILKRCPSLSQALLDLFNCCWVQADTPTQWKVAAIKLIGKGSASNDPQSPGNFRPIALTPCIGKIFTTVMRNRWLSFMMTNGYINRDIQKAFMPGTPGCTEHHCKLAAILTEARRKHKSLAVCWLDLANAYGSVHHSLIQFAVQHYHAPPQFQRLLQSLYSGLAGRVLTADWATPTIPLAVGVYQGDPLSVVIFNTVINTLVDTLQTRPDLGYAISNSSHRVNVLQYADDTCIVADSPASAQHLLDMTSTWLQWSGMQAKPSKCHAVALAGSTGKLFDPRLRVSDQDIPYPEDGPVKFLGLTIQIPHDLSHTRQALISNLNRMLNAVDACPLTRRQKLLLYKAAICPRLNWLLMIEELPLTWVERELEAVATRFLKKWSGLARSANIALLYLTSARGGLNLPAISSLYKRLQTSRQCQLLTSPDPCVRHLAERHLKDEEALQRKNFKAAVVVRDVMAEDPGRTRKGLREAVKKEVIEEDDRARQSQLFALEKQGQMLSTTPPDAAPLWSKAIQSLPPEQSKFALNAAVDTLPHNANLHLWKKKESCVCPLCGERQTLIHVLNCCTVARDLRRYNTRHDEVLQAIVDAIKSKLKSTASLSADLGEDYSFPTHIVATDLKPDVVCWDDSEKKITLVELTIPFETSFDGAVQRKELRYEELVGEARVKGYDAALITIEVGSRGVPNMAGFTTLQRRFALTRRERQSLLASTIRKAIHGSFVVWTNRNKLN